MIALLLLIASPNDAVTRARFYGAVADIPPPADASRVITIHGRVYEDGTPAEVTEPLPDVRDAYAYAIIGALRGLPPPQTAASRPQTAPIAFVHIGRTHVITRDGNGRVETAVVACAPRSDTRRVLFIDVAVQRGKVVAMATGTDQAITPCIETYLRQPADGVTSMAIEIGPPRPVIEIAQASGPVDVQDAMQSARDAIRACDDPNAPGIYKMRFVIGVSGEVSAIDASAVPRGGEHVSKCIADAIRGLRFPKPRNAVIVNYPFVFKQQL
jgi:hypothetical protein